MVQILPQRTNLGSQIGSAFGQGFNNAVNQALPIQYERSLIQQGIDDSLNGLNPDSTPIEIASSLIKAFAGIKDGGRAIGPLFDAIMKNRFYENTTPYNQNRNVRPPFKQNQPQQQGSFGNQPQQTEQPQQPPQQEFMQTGGLLPRVKSTEDLINEAKNRAQFSQNPETAYQHHLSTLKLENDINKAQISEAEEKAKSLGVSDQDLPEFMRIGQKFASIPGITLNEWSKKTNAEFGNLKNMLTSLDKVNIPGWLAGAFGKRENFLERATIPVQNLVKAGYEAQARAHLANQGLSETEINGLVHPLDKSVLKKIPKGIFKEYMGYEMADPTRFKTYDEIMEENPKKIEQLNKILSKSLLKSIDKDTSLSVLRHELWKNHGWDWRQFSAALQQAIDSGLELEPWQKNELPEVLTRAPRQSLVEIWAEPGRILDRIKGLK